LAGVLITSSGCKVLGRSEEYRHMLEGVPRGLKKSIGNPFEDKGYWRDLPGNFWDSLFGIESQSDIRDYRASYKDYNRF